MPRAFVPALGAVLLVGVTVLLVVALTVTVTGFAPSALGERSLAAADADDPVVVEATADSATGRVSLEHVSGPPLDVRRLEFRVEVDGEPLVHQPPVPFYAAAGFYGFPTGPFNPASDPAWSRGETGSFTVAATNDPSLVPGATVTVTLSRDGQLVARATTTAS